MAQSLKKGEDIQYVSCHDPDVSEITPSIFFYICKDKATKWRIKEYAKG